MKDQEEVGIISRCRISSADFLQMSTCTGLAALDFANTKFSKGYTATGVGMCSCGQHEIVMANGVGDMQKGER